MNDDGLFKGFLIGIAYSVIVLATFMKLKRKIDSVIDIYTVKIIKKFIKK